MIPILQVTQNINTWKSENKHSIMSSSEFREVLNQCKFPRNTAFWTVFSKSQLVVKVGWNQYSFADDSPIHYKLIETIYKSYRNYYSNHKVVEDTETKAIEYLKAKGYLILKQM